MTWLSETGFIGLSLYPLIFIGLVTLLCLLNSLNTDVQNKTSQIPIRHREAMREGGRGGTQGGK